MISIATIHVTQGHASGCAQAARALGTKRSLQRNGPQRCNATRSNLSRCSEQAERSFDYQEAMCSLSHAVRCGWPGGCVLASASCGQPRRSVRPQYCKDKIHACQVYRHKNTRNDQADRNSCVFTTFERLSLSLLSLREQVQRHLSSLHTFWQHGRRQPDLELNNSVPSLGYTCRCGAWRAMAVRLLPSRSWTACQVCMLSTLRGPCMR